MLPYIILQKRAKVKFFNKNRSLAHFWTQKIKNIDFFLCLCYTVIEEKGVIQLKMTVIRSDRKTLAIQIKNGEVIVRAPRRAREVDIQKFIEDNMAWIEKHLAEARRREAELPPVQVLSEQELASLVKRARALIGERVEYYAQKMGVSYGRISIRKQRTRWGSCSREGNLNFNCALALAPLEVLDSVVVHELAHTREMNHSRRFYSEVYRVFPDYDKCRAWLNQNGGTLLRRIYR